MECDDVVAVVAERRLDRLGVAVAEVAQ